MPFHRIARLAASGLLAAAVLTPTGATPATALTTTGHIHAPATPAGNPATDVEWQVTCPTTPRTQGVNAYVFKLPAPALAGDTVSFVGSNAPGGVYDTAAYVYDKDCNYRRVENGAPAMSLTLQADDQYFSVFLITGAEVDVTMSSPAAPTTGGGSGPNDPLFNQSGAGDTFTAGQWGMRKIHAPDAWTHATGSGIKVAILDTGIDTTHPDLNCGTKIDLVPGADPDDDGNTVPEDDNGHGTHVAGIIGACTNNGIGVAGVAPDSTLMPIQVISATGGTPEILEQAIDTAVAEGAHVINMSLSFGVGTPLGTQVPGTGSALGYLGALSGIRRAIDDAVAAGVVVVAAAGNDSFPICSYPALEWNVVCVGASDPRDLNSWYGNFPVKDDDNDVVGPALLAPGGTGQVFCDLSSEDIISTYARSADIAENDCDGLTGYATIAGTSMATPHVAGVAALVYDHLGGVRSKANADKVVEALIKGTDDLYAPGYDPMSGYGRLNALKAVTYWP